MQMSLDGKIMLAGLEGVSVQPYLDSMEVKTIGLGATRTELPDIAAMPWDYQMTIQDVFSLFGKSLTKYENAVNRALTVPVTQTQFDALVSICYNIGMGGMARSTFIRRINANADIGSIFSAIMMWDIPSEIIGRRNKEATLFATGRYSGGGKALLFPINQLTHRPMYSHGKSVDVRSLLGANTVVAPPTPTSTSLSLKDLIISVLKWLFKF